MSFFIAVLYGFVQGISEFLPISSSAHLALIPAVFKFPDPGVAFDLAMHLGTALAVMIYFHKVLIHQVKNLPKIFDKSADVMLTRCLVVATVASFILIVLFKPLTPYFRNPIAIAINQVVFGVVLWLSDRNHQEKKQLDYKSALLIGLAQAIAVFPGVSRSGITLATAFFIGLRKEKASEFSFLLSLPVILGGAAKLVPDLAQSEHSIELMLLGIFSSFVFGILTIHFFMKLLKRIQFAYFMYYRILLAILIFIFLV